MAVASTDELSFEALVALKSTRSDDAAFAVGYYISLRLLLELNARSPPLEQVDSVALQQVVQFAANARMFKRSSFAMHERVDDLFLADSDVYPLTALERSELTRLQQVAKRASHATFCDRMKQIVPNGKKLLSKLQQALVSAIEKYSNDADPTEAVQNVAGADEKLTVTSTAAAPLPKPALRPPIKKTPPLRPLSRAARPVFPVLQVLNASVDTIRRETSVARAYEIYQRYPLRFAAYRVFFKNDHTKLATDISRCCMDKLTKTEIRTWIRTKIGSVPLCKPKQQPKQSVFLNWELRHLALVATALTVYGEHVLSALYDNQAMELLKDIPLVSDEVRDARKQKLCLQRARVSITIDLKRSGEYHAAHYLPLDLTIQWNNILQPELRLSARDLRGILNLQCNMKAVRKRVNIKDHRKVEHFIASFIRQSGNGGGGSYAKLKCASWLVWRNTKDRLAQIARRVQSQELRDAFLIADGQELFALIGRTFQQIEEEFAQRGYDFGGIWEQQEDKDNDPGNDIKTLPRLCELLR